MTSEKDIPYYEVRVVLPEADELQMDIVATQAGVFGGIPNDKVVNEGNVDLYFLFKTHEESEFFRTLLRAAYNYPIDILEPADPNEVWELSDRGHVEALIASARGFFNRFNRRRNNGE